MAAVSVGPSLNSRLSGTDAFRLKNVTFSVDLSDPGVHQTPSALGRPSARPAGPGSRVGSFFSNNHSVLSRLFTRHTHSTRATHSHHAHARSIACAHASAGAGGCSHTCNGGSHLQFWGVMHPLMRVHRHPTSSVMRIRRTSEVVSVARPRPTSEHLPRPHLVVAACAVGAMGPPAHRLQAHP